MINNGFEVMSYIDLSQKGREMRPFSFSDVSL